MSRNGERITFTTRRMSDNEVPRAIRYMQIIEILEKSNKPLTAKEIAVIMFNKGLIPSDERNFTAPRLTELSRKEIVEPVAKKKCQYTGKTVAMYSIKKQEEEKEQNDIYMGE